ncbi:Os03g0757750 [Oryza sativa Japonica Group]|uniref:Os03g0757750 protein n=1 Tax=Oryza sativa subsp. japonica TaxID=39947 RepID=A0A0P0W457_ORYSJ|nr:hypothetical protein EE612_020544 [Oryza sativa]BAS86470.1 Os03g0757750 [Oryza sativa Japonica Group]
MGASGEDSAASGRIGREGSSGMDDDDAGLSAPCLTSISMQLWAAAVAARRRLRSSSLRLLACPSSPPATCSTLHRFACLLVRRRHSQPRSSTAARPASCLLRSCRSPVADSALRCRRGDCCNFLLYGKWKKRRRRK